MNICLNAYAAAVWISSSDASIDCTIDDSSVNGSIDGSMGSII